MLFNQNSVSLTRNSVAASLSSISHFGFSETHMQQLGQFIAWACGENEDDGCKLMNGITFMQLRDYKNGRCMPTPEQLNDLCKKLKATPRWLEANSHLHSLWRLRMRALCPHAHPDELGRYGDETLCTYMVAPYFTKLTEKFVGLYPAQVIGVLDRAQADARAYEADNA